MVFVMWDERYQAFVEEVRHASASRPSPQALAEKSGWEGIAGKPRVGPLQVRSHPSEPVQQRADDARADGLRLPPQEPRPRSSRTSSTTGFQDWMPAFERGVTGLVEQHRQHDAGHGAARARRPTTRCSSTRASSIDYLKNAEGRWGELRVVYPELNMWNDNPYYVLDVPWSTAAQREGGRRVPRLPDERAGPAAVAGARLPARQPGGADQVARQPVRAATPGPGCAST